MIFPFDMHRFFVPPQSIERELVALGGDAAHRIRSVLRLRPGDEITVLDDTGWEYGVELKRVDRGAVEGIVKRRSPSLGEPRTRLVLYQGVLKGGKFEMVLQKGTELGISSFVPVFCQRSVRRGGEDWFTSKYHRWRKIVSEAAEQCGRGRIPLLGLPMSFLDACDSAQGLRLLPWEGEDTVNLREALRGEEGRPSGEPGVSLFIGPEGGFTQEEVEFARSRGILSVSLGPRILRAETAALVAATAVLYELGEMNRWPQPV